MENKSRLISEPLFYLFYIPWYMCMLIHSVVPDSATLWIVAHQDPLSLGFSRQEYWNGLPCPPPGNLPDPELNPRLLHLLHRIQILYY